MTKPSARCFVVVEIALGAAVLFGLHLNAAAANPATPDTPAAEAAAPAGTYREIKWTDLLPKDWSPGVYVPAGRLGLASDLDPGAQAALAKLRLALDNAPTVSGIDGAQVKLPGYLVPLEEVRGEMTEFLLVPYFGACIHTPPPPANQIVFVRLKTPIRGYRSMDTVWVQGQLATTRQASYMGASGYRIDAVSVDRYAAPTR